MPSYLPRGELTTLLVDRLRAASLLVGDGVAPPTGGWDDDPNLPSSGYVPYLVINPMATSDPTGPVGDTSTDFRVPYSVTSSGISRKQVEVYADKGRKTLAQMERSTVTLGGGGWKIQQARANSIGGVVRTDNTEPSEYTQSDVVIIYLSKEIS
jgi:hypothetical protein